MNDLNDRTITIEKVFNAPLSVVWKAWTESEHIANWWAPKGMELTVLEHNFKVGGTWKYAMTMPNGAEFVSEGRYKEIVPMERIITTADFKPMTLNVELQAHFEADGDQTKFIFKVVHETIDYRKQQEEMGIYNGWGSAFERLDILLKSFEHQS